MREYVEKGTVGKLKRVVCNGCGKELRVEDGYLKEGCFHGKTGFGYFSRRDGVSYKFDLCEDCFDRMKEAFVVPAEESDETEMI